MPSPRVHSVDKAKARTYLGKANQFSAAAQATLMAAQHDAALMLAIHAGISAADAVTVALRGVRSTDPEHMKAADLMEDIAANSKEVHEQATRLRSLLKLKNLVEYEDRRASANDAADAAKRAERLLDWANQQVEQARL